MVDFKELGNRILTGKPKAAEGAPEAVDPSKARTDTVAGLVDGEEPVALSEGEFVIPADVVTKLGSGDIGSGARQLQILVDNIRRGTQREVGSSEQDSLSFSNFKGSS